MDEPFSLPLLPRPAPLKTPPMTGANDISYEAYEKNFPCSCCNARIGLVAIPCMFFGSVGFVSFIYLFFYVGGFNNFFSGLLVFLAVVLVLLGIVLLARSFKGRTAELLKRLQSHCAK